MNKNRQGSLLDFIDDFVKEFPKSIKQYDDLLTDNRISLITEPGFSLNQSTHCLII
jgi:NADH:ubiquinone oxidoreductase subunit D